MNTQPDIGPIALITADMGYGHQRAVYPLKELCGREIITAGSDFRTPRREKLFWLLTLKSYELLSRTKSLPIIGEKLFKLLDTLLAIPPDYPHKDHSASSFQVLLLEKFIQSGLCRQVIHALEESQTVLITSFYAVALAAEYQGLKEIYCIICDADLNRVWAAGSAEKSRINYLVPCGRALSRLLSYGVKRERIHLTGFPLPVELLGDASLSLLRANLASRLKRLDPVGRFNSLNASAVREFLGTDLPDKADGPVTVTFCVGGAGAQKELAAKILKSLHPLLLAGTMRLILVAGWRSEVYLYFQGLIKESTLPVESVEIIYSGDREDYFKKFNAVLATTDILWTKPSELSFYCALGLPVVMAPSIGAQERSNRQWLTAIGAGIRQENPDFTAHWLTDLLKSGRLAEAAWHGFLKARKLGTYKIANLLSGLPLRKEVYHPLQR